MTPKRQNKPESEPRREAKEETLKLEKETLRDLDAEGDDVRGGATKTSDIVTTKPYPCN